MMISDRDRGRAPNRHFGKRYGALPLFEPTAELESPASIQLEIDPSSRQPARTVSPLLLAVSLLIAQSLAIALIGIGLAVLQQHVGAMGTLSRKIAIALVAAGLFASAREPVEAAILRRGSLSLRFLTKSLTAVGLAELATLGGFHLLASTSPLFHASADMTQWAIAWFLLSAAAIGLVHIGAATFTERSAKQGRLARRILVVGDGQHGMNFIAAAQRWQHDMVVSAYFEDGASIARGSVNGVPYGGDLDQLADFARERGADEIAIALPWSAEDRIFDILARLRHLPIPIRLAPEPFVLRAIAGTSASNLLGLMPVLRDRPIAEWNLFLKNLTDMLLATAILLLVLPTMAVIAAMIRFDSPGPVLFRQKRLGFNGRPFDVLKFRTMTVAQDPGATLKQAARFDRRVTRVGRFLRRSSLDELPQLFNVLRGEMSLVGPRPHPIWTRAAELWPEEGDRPLEGLVADYAARHRVKPGITGWAQVCGCRGETETMEKMARRVKYDLYYIDNWSLLFDVKILALTAIAVVTDKAAY